MALAVTASFAETVLEIETSPSTYAPICGLKGYSLSRELAMDEDMVPDCADESLPFGVVRSPTSLSVSISCEAVWAQSSHKLIQDWIYSASTKNIRVRNTKAAVGDPETEAGPAYLTKLTNEKAKGKQYSASIEIVFASVPTRTNKA